VKIVVLVAEKIQQEISADYPMLLGSRCWTPDVLKGLSPLLPMSYSIGSSLKPGPGEESPEGLLLEAR
jgi:hypothetical protein